MQKKTGDLEKRFEDLKIDVGSYNKKADFALIDKAWGFAKLAHHEQKRLSGDPYVLHSLSTAEKLADWKLDTTSIVVGLLHDTEEKGGATEEDIKKEFGEQIASLVDGVSLISQIELKGSDKELFVENLRKMFLAMGKDLRVVLVRLAERYHNMETLSYLDKDRQLKIAKETLEIFAPLAERLGMSQIKGILEDLAFPYIYPRQYKDLISKSSFYYKKAKIVAEKAKKTLLKKLAGEGIKAHIQTRQKHLYSLWKKLQRPEIDGDFEKVNDIVAIRILVNNVSECYSSLGIVHDLYKPVPYLKITDFIAKPKPNGYRSIHTKVLGPKKKIIEVQIRTFDMHEEDEYGIAAHWHLSILKTKGKLTSEDIEKGVTKVEPEKLRWVKELVKWQKEIVDSQEFLKAVKFDALSERIFIFSPKGDVYDLPSGATPIDFAYAVHTSLGNFIKGAKVDGKVVTLHYNLKNGQVVEIIKTKNANPPSSGWLDFAVTTIARKEIKKCLRKSS